MWTRAELKARAKSVLSTSYWKAFLVSLLLAITGEGLPSCALNSSNGRQHSGATISTPGLGHEWSGDWGPAMIAIAAVAIFVGIVVALAVVAFRIFVLSPLAVGGQQYFKQAAQEDVNMNHLGHGFARGHYKAVVKGMIWKDFLNFLWFLLLIIPGYVKYYAYSMVPFILAENPGIGTKRAVELSNRMTRGHKWRMFVLDLSFIGWYLLGALALGIGILFVLPYVYSTKAELYLVLRQQALQEGICSRAELNLPELFE
ncbi:DUF975 family protein [Paenibacillus cremeus]|uniref:DUF975 family protein n=1 Tax=Paenibacillus cremeus TaxID=2163881 RepID=A0A559KFJ4_9BACL|nr:DUF975 family protein [Paenibacillus cremeus]TVY10878.1 DUF975 family protein [Paenibacillus cremeus]